MDFRLPVSKNKLIIAYKLLNDLLFLILLFFIIALVADGLITGIVSNHISFLKIILLLGSNLTAIYILGRFLNLNLMEEGINKKIAFLLLIMAALLIFNSLLKLNLFLAIFILLITLVTGHFAFKNILEDN